MRKILLVLLLLLATSLPAHAQKAIYICYDDGTSSGNIIGSRDEKNEKCIEPDVKGGGAGFDTWIAWRDRAPTQAQIDAQYNKLHCNQPGIRELIAVIADKHSVTAAQICTDMRGKRR